MVAYLFQPVYKWLLARGYKEGKATSLTFFATLLSVIIPLGLVIFVTVLQVQNLANSASTDQLNISVGEIGSSLIDSFNQLMNSWNINYQLSEAEVTQELTQYIQSISSDMVSKIAGSVSGIFGLITTTIIYIYVFFSLLKNQKKVIETLSVLNPLGEKVSDVYFRRMGSMTKAMVRGQFIIATMQGFASAVGLYIVGFHSLFFFFFLLLTVMSFIPLGAGIITIPLGVVLILMGDVWQGVFLIANHLIIVTNIDNVMRPRLVPEDARLDPALTILSVFAGLAMFGFFGIVLGPVLMIVIVTTIQMFLEVYRNVDALGDDGQPKAKKSIWSQLKKLNPKAKQGS